MELYVMAGFTPMEALMSATSVAARAMGVDGVVGTLAVGKTADLLVLDANPIDNISNVRRLGLVMRNGSLYESAALWRAAGFR
jgi:imidazolonepropionase-like amidohydrolase